MKKVILIIVFGLLWCNISFAETEQSIRDKYKSSLPECEDGEVDIEDVQWIEDLGYTNCVGTIRVSNNDPSFDYILTAEFNEDGKVIGKGQMLYINKGVTMFMTFKASKKKERPFTCGRKGYGIQTDGSLFKAKFKNCVLVSASLIK